MNWGRAKTLLIALFLLVDVFLLLILLQTRLASVKISDDIIQKTVQILNEHQIEVSAGQIPDKRQENQILTMKNYFEKPLEAAERLLGDTFETVASNMETHEYKFKTSSATLEVVGTSFTYSHQPKQNKAKKEAEKSTEELYDAIENMLIELGFAKNSFSVVSLQKREGLYECEVFPQYDKMRIYGVKMYVTADDDDILSIAGDWFTSYSVEQIEDAPLLDITAVLTKMMYESSCQGIKVQQVESGFLALDEYLSSREMAVVPVYIITDVQNVRHYFDARSGNAIL